MRVTRAVLVALAAAAGPAVAHDWYGELRDSKGDWCCNGQDCRRVEGCRIDGREGLAIAGACRPIDGSKVLPIPSPDGAAHACWIPDPRPARPPILRCILLPGSA
jgi:hypothetical protein